MYLTTIGDSFKMGTEAIHGLIDFPDMFGTPDKIEVTTQEDTQRKYVPGLQDPGDMNFTFGYEGNGPTTNWGKIKATVGEEQQFSLVFPDGSGFTWSGIPTLSMPGKGVGEALVFTLTISPTTDIEEISSTAPVATTAKTTVETATETVK